MIPRNKKVKLPVQVNRLFLLSGILAAAFMILTIVNYFHARQLMYNYLENEGVNFGQHLESLTRSKSPATPDNIKDLLIEISEKDFIAYVLLINRDKQLTAFNNPLAKTINYSKEVDQVLKEQNTAVRQLTLENGEKILEVNMPFHIGNVHRGQISQRQPEEVSLPKFQVLRIGIKQSHASRYIDSALLQVVLAAVILVIIFIFGLSQLNTLKDYFLLQEKVKDQEKLAAIGRVSAGLAHEIRNPVGAIKGLAQLLNEEGGENEEKIYHSSILKESVRLEHIVNELLDYTRDKVPHLSDIILRDVIYECIDSVSEQQGVNRDVFNVSVDQFLRLKGDRFQLEQVFINLFTNALQASKGEGLVEIEGSVEDSDCVIKIKDRGAGISKGKEKEIFQPFFTTKEKGIGLGLAISKQIILAHGGQISARNRKDGGAEFIVVMPKGGPNAV